MVGAANMGNKVLAGRAQAPAYIGSVTTPDPVHLARRLAAENSPTLHLVQGFRWAASKLTAEAVLDGATKAVDGVKSAADAAKETGKFYRLVHGEQRAILGAARHALAGGQLGFDLVRMRVAVSQAEEAVRS